MNNSIDVNRQDQGMKNILCEEDLFDDSIYMNSNVSSNAD